MGKLYNVYAWHDHAPAILVAKEVPIAEAAFVQETYLVRGVEWDAFLVDIDDDPGHVPSSEQATEVNADPNERLRIISLETDQKDIWFLKEILRIKHCRRIMVDDDDSLYGWTQVSFMADDATMLNVIDRLKQTLNATDKWYLKKVV